MSVLKKYWNTFNKIEEERYLEMEKNLFKDKKKQEEKSIE